jgi:hypothetical protein
VSDEITSDVAFDEDGDAITRTTSFAVNSNVKESTAAAQRVRVGKREVGA